MRRGELAVRGEYQLAARLRHLLNELLDCRDSFRIDRADVDDPDARREAVHDVAVDLGILLAAVADQDELEAGVGGEDLLYGFSLVLFLATQAEVAQHQRPQRQALHLEVLEE